MTFDPTVAAVRFGMGLSPTLPAPQSVEDMMARLAGPDQIARDIPIPTYSTVTPSAGDIREAGRQLNQARGTDGEAAAEAHRNAVRDAAQEAAGTFVKATFARAVHTPDGFRERLVRFWADHFTVRAVNGLFRYLVSPYIEEAIRPHVAGRFGDMLVAAVRSPMMIVYLDQHQSMGPNSRAARNNDRGLNENLARELLELHTLGVGGEYTQDDVRQLAELLTGLTIDGNSEAMFRPAQAEPGAETILGRSYGGGDARVEDVVAALQDLAVHPDTARHLARKMQVHFIGPVPDAALTEAMAARYLETGGQLIALYEVMLEAEAAWVPASLKVKTPFEFIASATRALGTPADVILTASIQDVRRIVLRPMTVMGQVWQSPVGPDGWPEDAADWITPQGMAGRITWSMTMPRQLVDDLPDPREFVYTALGPNPDEAVVFAASAAEQVQDGIGLVLASAAFQRR